MPKVIDATVQYSVINNGTYPLALHRVDKKMTFYFIFLLRFVMRRRRLYKCPSNIQVRAPFSTFGCILQT